MCDLNWKQVFRNQKRRDTLTQQCRHLLLNVALSPRLADIFSCSSSVGRTTCLVVPPLQLTHFGAAATFVTLAQTIGFLHYEEERFERFCFDDVIFGLLLIVFCHFRLNDGRRDDDNNNGCSCRAQFQQSSDNTGFKCRKLWREQRSLMDVSVRLENLIILVFRHAPPDLIVRS